MPEDFHHQQPSAPALAQANRIAGRPEPADLESTRRDFPRYQIDEELLWGRRRYIARRVQPGPGPHTLITGDLAELRAELKPRPGQQAAGPAAPPADRHLDD
jgi:hypothetical protein